MNRKFEKAIHLFDQANRNDPTVEVWEGLSFPKELLYAQRMTERLAQFAPDASEALQLAVRCQHICRWQIPRDSYEMNRKGYLTWRRDLGKFHANKAAEILSVVGYEEATIERVGFLLQKKQLKKDVETQVLEDVICLVFLEFYFEKFSEKYPAQKLIEILQKTWTKMSVKGQQAALELSLSKESLALISKALKD